MRKIIVLLLCLGLNGCATLIKSDWYQQTIKITSEPNGASIIVNGEPRYVYKIIDGPFPGSTGFKKTDELLSTPNEISLSINHCPYVLRLEKNGYEPVEIKITDKMSGWSLFNLINFIGWDIDRSTGAIDTLRPSNIHVRLKENIQVDYPEK